jgi:hypothetical protein
MMDTIMFSKNTIVDCIEDSSTSSGTKPKLRRSLDTPQLKSKSNYHHQFLKHAVHNSGEFLCSNSSSAAAWNRY